MVTENARGLKRGLAFDVITLCPLTHFDDKTVLVFDFITICIDLRFNIRIKLQTDRHEIFGSNRNATQNLTKQFEQNFSTRRQRSIKPESQVDINQDNVKLRTSLELILKIRKGNLTPLAFDKFQAAEVKTCHWKFRCYFPQCFPSRMQAT